MHHDQVSPCLVFPFLFLVRKGDMKFKTFLVPLTILGLLVGFVGCASVPSGNTSDNTANPTVVEVVPPSPAPAYVWQPELALTGPLQIDIYPDRNCLFVYRKGIQIGMSTISAGKEGHDTPPGNYTILQKELNHRSNLYGSFVSRATGKTVKRDVGFKDVAPAGAVFQGALMPYFQRLTNEGVGLHLGELPGYNASHGCIRLPGAMAKLLYAETRIGTPVRVIRGELISR
jgi:hypothetical protein